MKYKRMRRLSDRAIPLISSAGRLRDISSKPRISKLLSKPGSSFTYVSRSVSPKNSNSPIYIKSFAVYKMPKKLSTEIRDRRPLSKRYFKLLNSLKAITLYNGRRII